MKSMYSSTQQTTEKPELRECRNQTKKKQDLNRSTNQRETQKHIRFLINILHFMCQMLSQ